MKRYYLGGWILVAAWLSYMLFTTRYAMLDDALIHLRYATFLHSLHYITFDGLRASYGTSSLLYVSILALLRGITTSVFLPKIVSCFCYIGIIALMAVQVQRFAPRRVPQALWVGFLLTLLSPMAIRWLTDGMETSLVGLSVILLAISIQRNMHREASGIVGYCAWGIAMCLLVLLRIEMASLAFLAAGILVCGRLEQLRLGSRRLGVALAPTALILGAVLTLIGTRLVFGSFLPDTALAKSSHFDILSVTREVMHVLGSAVLFGVSMALLNLSSGLLLLLVLLRNRCSQLSLLAWLFANLPFPLVYALACSRGQAIQGIRTILWPLLFTTAWNVLELERHRRTQLSNEVSCRVTVLHPAWTYAAFLLCLLPFDWHYAMHAMRGRAVTFLAMRGAGLDRFHNSTIVAGDVGFIGYFTGGQICDMDGLVNGRIAAQETVIQRLASCVTQHPQIMFLTRDQQRTVNKVIPAELWPVCGHYDFTNVLGDDRHYLRVINSALCGGSPSSVDAHSSQ